MMTEAVSAETTDSEKRLQQLVDRISDVATLPAVFAEIMEVVNDPNAGAADLKAVVACDAALTSRVLKRINSAYFGLRTRIGNLQNAVSLLGFNAVRNLALTLSVSDMFKKEAQIGCYSRLGLWHHMLAVAFCARMIARRTGASQFEDGYLGGLLHDIGIMFFDQHDHANFREVIGALSPERPLQVCERAAVGFDHAELGAAVAGHWRFPEPIVECIRWHHESRHCSNEVRPIASAVELADFLCNKKGMGAVQMRYKPRLRTGLLTELKLGRDDLHVLWEDMDEELSAARDMFDL